MITITPYKSEFQNEINQLLLEISNEFETSIFSDQSNNSSQPDQYWIAIKDEKIIGTVAVIRLDTRCAILKKMFLKKEYRGNSFKVSRSLLATALQWCKSQNISEIFLGTMEQFIAAQKFYEKNGFKRIEKNQLPENFIYNPIDTVYFKKAL